MGSGTGGRWRAIVVMVGAAVLAAGCGGSAHQAAGTTTVAGPTTATTTSAAASSTTPTSTAPSTASPATTPPTTALARTAVNTYVAWTASGALASGLHATNTVQGSCFTTSIALDTSGVYRCMSGNDLYDPCFAGAASSDVLACTASPWAGVTLLDNTASLPVGDLPSSAPPTVPWAIELVNGAKCVIGTGANSQIGGVTVQYYCSGTSVTSSVDQTSDPWTVQYDPSSTSSVLTSVAVATAWD
jgi:hypothetical protein